ncbi:hypothetical protein E4P42_12605 [Mycobacterium sp. PS03-16]|uniref:hypothetical protein n=1 Tax=Mycobacterium sp. PS03-16 TaxID=2559611 RepID=UPI0010730F50|nr:hypothetical protein [Mycobacterium sp. PS03-16]TFV58204.1 hypothetical protein E4P42_12605 [Mycobacterium sp. PS03-16]
MSEHHAYLLVNWLNNQARCQCGYEGKRRWFRGLAVNDVLEHSTQTGHMPVGLPKIKRAMHAV